MISDLAQKLNTTVSLPPSLILLINNIPIGRNQRINQQKCQNQNRKPIHDASFIPHQKLFLPNSIMNQSG